MFNYNFMNKNWFTINYIYVAWAPWDIKSPTVRPFFNSLFRQIKKKAFKILNVEKIQPTSYAESVSYHEVITTTWEHSWHYTIINLGIESIPFGFCLSATAMWLWWMKLLNHPPKNPILLESFPTVIRWRRCKQTRYVIGWGHCLCLAWESWQHLLWFIRIEWNTNRVTTLGK